MIGGVGYVLSGFAAQLAPDLPAVGDVLTIPATVGEIWMVGYLLIFGVRRTAIAERSEAPRATVMPATSTSR